MKPIEIGGWTFDHVHYDREADVLYLSIGAPQPGIGEESPEGHILRFSDDGEFVGVTLVGVQEALDAGDLNVTLPRRAAISPRKLKPALA